MIPSGAACYDDGFCRMFVGDACDVLSQLPERSVHCCVTSPPYFGLRSYLAADHPEKAREGGTQETPEQYVQWLVEVFRGVWRVLRDDGTLWLNLGDSYAMNFGGGKGRKTSTADWWGADAAIDDIDKLPRSVPKGLKPKDLLMIPARVALALQADGWYLRSQIVWIKPNPMPESVTDRPTQATEMVYLLTKKPRYFYDAEAVKEGFADARMGNPGAYNRTPAESKGVTQDRQDTGFLRNGTNWNAGGQATGRNLRNYWLISTRPYPGSHYATFPPELPLRAVKAGTSEHGVCSECGAPWRRVVETSRTFESGSGRSGNMPNGKNGANLQGGGETLDIRRGPTLYSRTIGFEPTCSHDAETEPATVLDPFSGSGTTGLIARKLGRRSVLIDLDERNVRLLEQRMGYQGVLC